MDSSNIVFLIKYKVSTMFETENVNKYVLLDLKVA